MTTQSELIREEPCRSAAPIRRVAIISDAWHPQVNGVVRTLSMVKKELEGAGFAVDVIGPDRFFNISCPTYSEVRLALDGATRLSHHVLKFKPDAIHIATEGPLGWVARHLCVKWKIPFTTSFHTRWTEYLQARAPIPAGWSYKAFRYFHSLAESTLVPTRSIQEELQQQGFKNLKVWTRGVDHNIFRPRSSSVLSFPRPIQLYVGRVAVEKNLPAFLELPTMGTKLVVGDGPAREELESRYPNAVFLGLKQGTELAEIYSSADVFVFPSRTDTFGIVLLEALASGLPVAAFPVAGPKDIVSSDVGVLMEDLELAVKHALRIPREKCLAYAKRFSWSKCAEMFYENLVHVRSRSQILPY